MFASTTLLASRATRLIDPPSVLSWVMLVGFAIAIPVAALQGLPEGLDRGSIAWLSLAGLGNVGGLLLAYSALRVGKVGIVAPIVSTEGAIAAVVAVVAGEHLSAGSAVTLAVIAVGIVLAASARDPDTRSAEAPAWRIAAYALVAAVCFGTSLYATARVSADLPIAWALVPPRIAGVLFVALPLVATSRLRLTRAALPLVLASGVAELVGFALFAVGSRHGIAVSAVLASQFGALAAVAAYVLFRERLTRVQLAGVVTIVAGISVLSWLQA